MAQISIQPDCGNSPRKLFLKELIIAWSNGNFEFLAMCTSPDIMWEVLGHNTVAGKEEFIKAAMQHKARAVTVDTIITHGPEACVSGTVISADDKQYAFCGIYKFKGAGSNVLHSIKSFIIKL